ncbi:TetR family transcriptional regulator [Dactylosporangium vinaceum]|uniref:TetR family transcriptional regulator n=1 Tax=Dactylosporangium vinaceum TaxID=53362 RepID=A0ABV5MPA8_9ACTN|nr:TetR family transcriptional regulator [Dactylosporangium vinaceum]UAB94540.1 TetR family transcriptional regulator [Dactylosporangium vinaceum]
MTARRSDATRAAILRAARVRFAEDGYQRATIRAIAADAAIDPSMVMRYYGNKERLFAAAVDIDLRMPDVAGLPAERAGAELVRHWVRRWEDDPTGDVLLTLLRSAATDDTVAERVRDVFRDQIVPVVRQLSGAGEDEAAERAGLLATQMLGLAMCRHILRIPPVAAMTTEQVVQRVGATVQRYLTAAL